MQTPHIGFCVFEYVHPVFFFLCRRPTADLTVQVNTETTFPRWPRETGAAGFLAATPASKASRDAEAVNVRTSGSSALVCLRGIHSFTYGLFVAFLLLIK